MHRTRKITSAVLSVLTLAGSAYFLFTPSHVRADNAPDWLRAVSQNKLPEYPRDTDAVVLLDQRETVVKNNGDIETRYRRAYKLFRTEAAKEYGGVLVNFDQETQISFLKAWTIMPDGRQIEINREHQQFTRENLEREASVLARREELLDHAAQIAQRYEQIAERFEALLARWEEPR